MAYKTIDIIKKILSEQCECTVEIKESSHLIEDLELESIALLTLITELENHYQAVFDISERSNIQTIGDLVFYIEAKIEEQTVQTKANSTTPIRIQTKADQLARHT